MLDVYIDFTTPMWLVHYYYGIGTLNLVLNSYTLFLIIFKSAKIDSVKYFIFAFQCSCLSVDFHLTFLMQPQPLHPLPAGFITGIASDIISVHIMMTSVMMLIFLQFQTIFLCFLKKLVVFRNLKRLETNKYVLVSAAAIFLFMGFCIVLLFYNAGLNKEEMFVLIREQYPSYEKLFSSLSNLAIYRADIFWYGSLVGTFVAFIYCGTFFIYATYSMFTTLNELSKTVSNHNLKKQKTALVSLVVQLLTLATALFPVGFLVFLLVIEYKYAQWGTRLELMLYCFHSTANAVVVVVTIPSFRKFTFFWLNKKHSPIVVSVQ